jgi:hypothetical protein
MTIVSAELFHFSVRKGKRWFQFAPMTGIEKSKFKFKNNYTWPLDRVAYIQLLDDKCISSKSHILLKNFFDLSFA